MSRAERRVPVSHQTILVLDFGSQYTQLIARRLRELSVYSEIVPFDTALSRLRERKPSGIILSGGPSSVSDVGAPRCDPAIFELGTPVLGICYGMQLMTDVLGGSVQRSGHREFGHAVVRVRPGESAAPSSPQLFANVPPELRVWASHGDRRRHRAARLRRRSHERDGAYRSDGGAVASAVCTVVPS